MFFFMGAINLFLFMQIRERNKMSRGVSHALKKETDILIVVLILFELSYLFRFIVELFANEMIDNERAQLWLILQNIAFIFEGISFLFLLVIHFKNFKPREKNVQSFD